MTDPAASRLPIEPWRVREIALDLGRMGQMESLFALPNGHIGLRGNLDEGEPSAIPGTYLGSFYEQRPLPYPEGGYGYPEAGQTIVNVTNGKLIRLLADDSPFDIRYGKLVAHERTLDLRAGSCGARRTGSPRPGAGCGCGRPAWCPSPSARSRRSPTKWSRSGSRRGSSCSPNGRERSPARARQRRPAGKHRA